MKRIMALILAAVTLMLAPAACSDSTTLEEDAAGTNPVVVSPVNAVDKAEQAKDIENQAREAREQQMQNEVEGVGGL